MLPGSVLPSMEGRGQGWVREARAAVRFKQWAAVFPTTSRSVLAPCGTVRPKFTRQLPIGPYFADFACRQAKLVVELDGSQHSESARDARRDRFLEQEGWAVLRIWNNELDENAEGVFQAIVSRAAECLGGTHPQPLPSREGRLRRRRSTSAS